MSYRTQIQLFIRFWSDLFLKCFFDKFYSSSLDAICKSHSILLPIHVLIKHRYAYSGKSEKILSFINCWVMTCCLENTSWQGICRNFESHYSSSFYVLLIRRYYMHRVKYFHTKSYASIEASLQFHMTSNLLQVFRHAIANKCTSAGEESVYWM